MLEEILKYDRDKNKNLEKVFLVIFTKRAFDEFEEVFRKL
jgi:O-acetyl-ADP-ribose deacetylase (regulator of RNase III)